MVATAGGEDLALGGPKQRTVLALLVAAAGNPVSIDALISGVYGDDAGGGARRTIHTYVSNLRGAVGDAVIRSADGYRIDPEVMSVDAVEFEEQLGRGSGLVATSPSVAADTLCAALALWRGHPYADIDGRSVLDGEIVRLLELRLNGIESRVAAELALGAHQNLIGELSALVEEHPLRERFRAQLMLALYRSGRQSDALRAFTRARETLGQELGIEPSRELQELEQRILDQDPVLDLRPAVTIEQRAIVAVEHSSETTPASLTDTDRMLARRNEILSNSAEQAGGTLLDVRGTAAFGAFPSVTSAVEAAQLVVDPSTQVAIDFGDIELDVNGAGGPPVTVSLRLVAVGHAGQVLLSEHAHTRLAGEGGRGWAVEALGPHAIRGLDRPLQVYQLVGPGFRGDHPALRLDRLPPPLWGVESTSVPGYELRDVIATDMAGSVHAAYQPSTGREVAIRSFRPELVADPRFVRRFEAVSQLVVAVDHPNLRPLNDFWRGPASAFWVYAPARGASVEALLNTDAISASDALGILSDVGHALDAAHEQGLAHGRVSAASVTVDGTGRAAISDLGLAAMLDGMATWPADAFKAPELIGKGPTQEGDVHAVAVLAAELLSGLPVEEDRAMPAFGPHLDDVIARAVHPDPRQRYSTVGELIRDIHYALEKADGAGITRALISSEARNPYKGLKPFDEGDARDFFGRREMIATLVASVAAHSVSVVAGPSGIGKSSTVRAGLVPALRHRDDWMVTDMFPGARPFDALERALDRVAVDPVGYRIDALISGSASLAEVADEIVPDGRLLIVIDQFEELFTQTADEQMRRAFLSMLAGHAADAGARVRVVVTIRADFLDRPLQYAEFADVVAASALTMGAPGSGELAEIIERPLESVGVGIQSALSAVLVRDAGSETGALPLLQHALTELFDQRSGDVITLDDYRVIGNLTGSVGKRAEAVFRGVAADDQAAVKEVFLHIVTMDESGVATRRRVRRSHLPASSGPETLDRVLDAFGRHRLLVFDRDPTTRGATVEIAHEALLGHWPRLADWVEDAREDLVFARRLESAVSEWENAGQDPSYLLSGNRLDRAIEWRRRSVVQAPVGSEVFVDRSVERGEAEHVARQRQRRRVVGILAVAAALATVMAIAAWIQRGAARDAAALAQAATLEADEQREVAETAAALAVEEAARADEAAEEANAFATRAQAQRLILEADRLIASDPELAVHLGLLSMGAFFEGGGAPATAVNTLRRALSADRVVHRFAGGDVAAVSADGSEFATASESGGVTIWDVASREQIEVIEVVDGRAVNGVAYTAIPGEIVVSFDDEGPLMVRDPSARTWSTLPGTDGLAYIRFSPDGRWYGRVIGSSDGLLLEVLDRANGDVVFSADAASVPFDLSDRHLAYSRTIPGADGTVVDVIDLSTGQRVWDTGRDRIEFLWPSFSPSGERVVLSSPDGRVALVDAASGNGVWSQTGLDRSWRPVWVDEGRRLAFGGEAQFTVIDAETGDVAFEIAAHDGGSFAYDPIPGTSLLLSAGQVDRETLLIDMVPEVPELGFIQAPFFVEDIGVADGILAMTGEGQYALWDLENREMLGEAAPGELFGHLDNPAALVVGDVDGRHVLVDRRTTAEIYRAPPDAAIVGISVAADLVVVDRPEGPVDLVTTTDGGVVAQLDAGGEVMAMFTHDGAYVVTRDNSEQAEAAINLWRTSNGSWVAGFGGLGDITPGGWDFDISDDDDSLVVGGYDGTIQVFELQELIAGASAVDARIFNQQAHSEFVREVEFDGGEVVMSRAFDSSPRMWMVPFNEAMGEFATESTSDATFSPLDLELLATDGDRVLRHVWAPAELVELAKDRLSRDLTDDECEFYLGDPCEVALTEFAYP